MEIPLGSSAAKQEGLHKLLAITADLIPGEMLADSTPNPIKGNLSNAWFYFFEFATLC